MPGSVVATTEMEETVATEEPKGLDAVEEAQQRLAANYQQSSFRESLLEHAFVSEILQEAWFVRGEVIEVLRAEVDAFGYDLVLQLGGCVRHVQLKASKKVARQAGRP